MNCPSCGHSNKAYLDFCAKCHVALDGSGMYEQGFGPKGKLPLAPEPRDLPWVFLFVAIVLWGIGVIAFSFYIAGYANKGSNPLPFIWLFVFGGMAFSKYIYEKHRKPKQ